MERDPNPLFGSLIYSGTRLFGLPLLSLFHTDFFSPVCCSYNFSLLIKEVVRNKQNFFFSSVVEIFLKIGVKVWSRDYRTKGKPKQPGLDPRFEISYWEGEPNNLGFDRNSDLD